MTKGEYHPRKPNHIGIYGVYDLEDDETVVFIGSRIEVSNFLAITPSSVSKAVFYNRKVSRRYRIKFIYYERKN